VGPGLGWRRLRGGPELVTDQYQHVPLGTHANKHGRVIGHNLAGSYATFPGVVGTAVSKVCHLEIARTGLRERDARRAGFAYVTVTVRSGTKAAYFPGARQMTVKMIAERRTGRLLGVQIVGGEGSAKRIDTAATALWNRMTVEEITALDLAYARRSPRCGIRSSWRHGRPPRQCARQESKGVRDPPPE